MSAVFQLVPDAVRRTYAHAVSNKGTPRMKTGIKSGAKKKKVTPEVGGVRPPITIVEALMRSPSNKAPASPMNIFAG